MSKLGHSYEQGVVMEVDSIEWFIRQVKRLPSDAPVEGRQPGFNNYSTQKEHWLGWLDSNSVTGTYTRKSVAGRDAKYVYNHIMEPKMLIWIITAAGVSEDIVESAVLAADSATSMAGKSAAIRKNVPWAELSAILSTNK